MRRQVNQPPFFEVRAARRRSFAGQDRVRYPFIRRAPLLLKLVGEFVESRVVHVAVIDPDQMSS
jgi:hypothetical protein